MIGREISHYRVLSRLGAGGMGVVYEAEDLRLGRRVAIKMLPEMEKRPEALERFRREARSASALNHPNICTIYEIEEHEGQQFIVMELLQGQTLAHKIGNRPLKTELVLEYGIQIAEALDAAHKKGIVHRDIKSGNLFINERGQIKVLDFGLAKLEEKNAPIAASAATASAPEELTGRGTTLGTLLYMSPEQARGEELDARSDIFSFGTVLYEMATGMLPFRGSTPAVVFNEILSKNPPQPSRLNPDLPLKLDEVILKALEKDKELRYQSVSEIRADLRRLKRDSESSASAAVPTSRAKPRRSRELSALAGIAVVLVGAVLWWRPWARNAAPVVGTQWEQLTDFDSVSSPALSPDGRMVAFIRGQDTFINKGQIYVKLLPNGQAKQLTNDNMDKMGPAFSPDGSQITYTALDERFSWNTYSVPVLGGTPQIMLPNAAGLTWIGSHQLLFSEIKTGVNMAIVTSDDSRMREREIYLPPTARGMAHRSALSPDGKSVLLAEMDNAGWQPCRLLPFDGANAGRRAGPLDAHCTYVAWSPDGKWMYFSAAQGAGFHLWRQRTSGGEPEQITFGPTEQEGIAIDPEGKFLITAAGTKQSELWLHDANGERQISAEGFAAGYAFSPNGKQLFYMVLDYAAPSQGFISGTLRSADLQTGAVSLLLPGVEVSDYDLTHDGKNVIYAAYDEQHRPHLWIAPLDRSSPPRQLFPEEADEPRVTDSGVIYYRARINGANRLFRYKPDGTREEVGKVQVNEIGSVSPDGKWVSAWTQDPNDPNHSSYFAINTQDFTFVHPCPSCGFSWSADGRSFMVVTDPLGRLNVTSIRAGSKTILVSLKPGEDLPTIPPGGWQSAADFKGYKVREFDGIGQPSPDGTSYVFPRRSSHRNLFRISLQ